MSTGGSFNANEVPAPGGGESPDRVAQVDAEQMPTARCVT